MDATVVYTFLLRSQKSQKPKIDLDSLGDNLRRTGLPLNTLFILGGLILRLIQSDAAKASTLLKRHISPPRIYNYINSAIIQQ